MHLERLKQMVRVLRTVEQNEQLKNSFDLSDWVADINIDADINESYLELYDNTADNEQMLTIPHNCGTTACACGYAGLDPWFRKEGFITDETGNVTFGVFESWGAVEKFFGLTEVEGVSLFSRYSYEETITPSDVIVRIAQMIQTEEPEYVA